mmetsp:Transcript_30536/g.57804  ORF Transcript_30536/g.57804 Transcript_30536/m.57804 type:complete len:264 (+) Transcript_30536:1342-2133(+)
MTKVRGSDTDTPPIASDQAEGNNCVSALIHHLNLAAYNATDSIIKKDTLNVDWIADNMSNNTDDQAIYKETIKENGVNYSNILEKQFHNEQRIIRKTITIHCYYGKTRKEFQALNMPVNKAHEAIIDWSWFLSKHKRDLVTPPQCTYISNRLWDCVAALNRLHQQLPEDHYPTYSKLSNSYIANEASLKDDHMPPQYEILDSDKWISYRDDPTSQNLDRFAEKWKARLMRDGGGTGCNQTGIQTTILVKPYQCCKGEWDICCH